MSTDLYYDLLTEPAFPVRWVDSVPADRRPEAVGLRELFVRAHEISALAVSLPPALSALYRVLYALTTRITAVDTADDWHEARFDVRDAGRFDPDGIDRYFTEFAERFRLYDPVYPFLQDPRLKDQCDKTAGLNKLVTTRPSGSNHAWFEHAADARPVAVASAQALEHLLVWRYYGPSGRCSARTVGPVKEANCVAGPLRTALSYHPVGATLFETLLAGLPEPDRTRRYQRAADPCPWERNEPTDPLTLKGVVTGPMSKLVGHSQHALLLVPDRAGTQTRDAYITWAYRERIPRDDDFLIWQISQAGNRYARYADARRGLWRDLDALLLSDPPGVESRRPPVISTAAELFDETFRIQALGIEQEGQAKDTQVVSATTAPVLHLMQERDLDTARLVGQLRLAGERYGQRLERAAKQAWAQFTNSKVHDCSWSAAAAARYWPEAEREFWKRLEEGRFEGAAGAFRASAEQIYDYVTEAAAGTARGARAREFARIELYGGRPKKTTGAKRPAQGVDR
ncbi:type I-E CRISPR-associated protein Cse1/CasA [Streptomyces lydicamycinicus]|uniref:type I-E CRISPR-associated protein Cse1/CasA n=1 Tax=Streptomyces lydicamycinicus TaxID=1546107 RepID=UPI0020356767|nr:type I-E CRISPR-associated protein Cse1/CasA [Streptomyces lydicamycinicus]URZ99429.1 type I-E CRISPR-associated protein Cse1/CasA [Streptomyces lydicamycinicus]